MDSKLYWLWLSLACGAGSRLPMMLLRKHSSAEAIYNLANDEILETIGKSFSGALKRLSDKDLSRAEEILSWCEAKNVSILTPDDADFPKSLLQMRDPPVVLYYVGKLPKFNEIFSAAVVGTRKMTDYGKQMAYDIGYGLGEGGACVVSGMALGVDGMAMSGAIAAGGKTVAVIGSGIDIVYPHEHLTLFKQTVKSGAVITEYAPGTPPASGNFPIRNRIISGLCQATVVVEADNRSGALITARHAIYQGRDLYAVPGKIGEINSDGTLQLIKSGAKLVTDATDILRNYEFMYPHSVRVPAGLKKKRKEYSVSADEAAELLHISSSGKQKYYGTGVYGGKDESAVKTKGAARKGRSADSNESQKLSKTNTQSKNIDYETADHNAQTASDNAPAVKSGGTIPASRLDLDMLGENEIKIYNAMTPDVPMLPDEIARKGFSLANVMSAMTLLEISGVVECGAGGYYLRRSADGDLSDGRFDDGIGE